MHQWHNLCVLEYRHKYKTVGGGILVDQWLARWRGGVELFPCLHFPLLFSKKGSLLVSEPTGRKVVVWGGYLRRDTVGTGRGEHFTPLQLVPFLHGMDKPSPSFTSV